MIDDLFLHDFMKDKGENKKAKEPELNIIARFLSKLKSLTQNNNPKLKSQKNEKN